jgi:glutamyl-tRNA synthetase
MTASLGGRGRYAPSPTGPLHMGNLRTALLAWLFARHAESSFVLRIEDIDWQRSRSELIPGMLADLRWLGIDWDEGPDVGGPYSPYMQSQRIAHYKHYLEILVGADRVYPCYCSRADIAFAASAPHADQGQSKYPGTCREPEGRARQQRENPDRRPAYRFRVPDGTIVVRDRVQGKFVPTLKSPDHDFIVWRTDGAPAYHLAVVVDDALMRIGEVVRGEDLLDCTPLHAALIEALGFVMPRFAHVPLWRDSSGNRLSKRESAAGLASYRDSGMQPEHVVGLLAESCGLVPPDTPLSAVELLASFAPVAIIVR